MKRPDLAIMLAHRAGANRAGEWAHEWYCCGTWRSKARIIAHLRTAHSIVPREAGRVLAAAVEWRET